MRIIAPLLASLAATATLAAPSTALDTRLPAERHDGELAYVTGGVGRDEALAMEHAAKKYPLELVFVARDGKRDDYLADVPVTIKDHKGNVVFEGSSDGPYFLARLPAGRYVITSREGERSFTRRATVDEGKTQRIVFEWKAGASHSA
jgi:hypothetical protein